MELLMGSAQHNHNDRQRFWGYQ